MGNKFIPEPHSIEMWVVCAAIEENRDAIRKMKKNEDGSCDVSFTVGGVELDFEKLCRRIDEETNRMALEKAKQLVDEKYGTVFEELEDIRERLEHQKKELFSYDWEK